MKVKALLPIWLPFCQVRPTHIAFGFWPCIDGLFLLSIHIQSLLSGLYRERSEPQTIITNNVFNLFVGQFHYIQKS